MLSNQPQRRPLALVTGASDGIGAAFARELAARGYDLVLTARRSDRLQALANELKAAHDADSTIIVADLEQPGSPQRIVDALDEQHLAIDLLVNNAGYGVPGVVDQQVDGQALFVQRIDDPLRRARLVEVGDNDRGIGIVHRLQLVRQRLQPLAAPCRQHHRVNRSAD